ncbi:MAG: hypothetical protein U0R24_00870 [Solirubrobacterales bacterium]
MAEVKSRSVPDAIAVLLARDDNLEYGLLAVLDSSPTPATSTSLGVDQAPGFTVVDQQVLVDRVALAKLIRAELFNGFDEVWLFERRPTSPRPPGSALTTDIEHFEVSGDLNRWVESTDARVGLGDGVALRVVTSDDVLMDALVGTA